MNAVGINKNNQNIKQFPSYFAKKTSGIYFNNDFFIIFTLILNFMKIYSYIIKYFLTLLLFVDK